ncbi:MAG: PEP/pyruvate-binding domain-containing protein [Clostridiales Family XIII bacterium]|jgi:hypothetical protein|nr:PEP/pyruvate-binding domain-containing protein [Clostridiales Family XIII bacterium]
MINQKKVYSGFEGLDSALDFMRYGDSVVWQVSDIDEYDYFVGPFVGTSIANHKNVVYFRFGKHNISLDGIEGVSSLKIRDIDISEGFETAVMSVYDIIQEEGPETHYVFDSMTELQVEWIADFTMGNFFVVTAPEIKKAKSIAYFAYTRTNHSTESLARIREASSILIDVVRGTKHMYMQPLKVEGRYLPTIFLPHVVDRHDNDIIRPLTNGIDLSHYFTLVGANGDLDSSQNLDNWERFFLETRNHATDENANLSSEDIRSLCSLIFGKDEHMLDIAERNTGLQDILDIKARMIGVGRIGGKATGMLMSRMIVEKQLPEIAKVLEPHDSFYICSNLYYTFLIKNKCWGLKIKQRKRKGYFPIAEVLKEKIMEGQFSDNIREQFRRMLEYYGQSPIIVRSSSILEDGFGNAFAGKYDSVFCVNKGTLEERLEDFEAAVKQVYASTMDDSVLEYRLQRDLAGKEEQMALLVQRVSGSLFKDIYMPAAAGVAFSYNQYRWNTTIDPDAGVVRLVMGLGTRAVDRTDGDYPRIAALDQPQSQAVHGDYISDFAQHKVDVLDLTVNSHTTLEISEVTDKMTDWFKAMMIERDPKRSADLEALGVKRQFEFTTCKNILENEKFLHDISEIIHTVQSEYSYPVDVEFALNFSMEGDFVINLLQCRPLQVGGSGLRALLPSVEQPQTFFHLNGGTMGGAYYQKVDVVIRIDPQKYYEYAYNSKPTIARITGQINQHYKDSGKTLMLLVPGRLGTSSPELGVPVSFAEISNVSIACEVSYEGAGYKPELSYGSHFFLDLVEADIFYASIFENKGSTIYYDEDFFGEAESLLTQIVPDVAAGSEIDGIIKVYDTSKTDLRIVSDIESGETLCGYFETTDLDGNPI